MVKDKERVLSDPIRSVYTPGLPHDGSMVAAAKSAPDKMGYRDGLKVAKGT
jgi:hypothetical protein